MSSKFAKAIADNPGESDSELIFKIGDMIKVTSEDTGSEGWWEGELNGNVGYFPASYVTYDIDGDDYAGDDNDGDTDTVIRDKVGKVIFDYEPSGDDDLSAKAGDVVKYAEVPDSPEWVDAELNGTTGYIPKSYIEEISDDVSTAPVNVLNKSSGGSVSKSGAGGDVDPAVKAALTPPPAPTKKRPKTFYMGSTDIFKVDSEYRWKCEVPPATITLSVCEKKAGGIKKFTTYKLTSDKTGKSVERRYNNFLWLNQRLSEQFPLIALPYLPEKQMSGRFNSLFLGYRSRQLERYINYCTHHPILGSSQLMKFFLENPGEVKDWKAHKETEYTFITRINTEKPVNPSEATATISSFKGYATAHRKAIRDLGEAMQDLTDKLRSSTGEYEKLIEKLTQMQGEKCWIQECKLCGELSSKFSDIIEIYKTEMSFLTPESKILHISEAADRFEFNTEAFYRLEKRIESAEAAILKKPNEITTENVSRARAIMLAELEMFHENQIDDFNQALVSTAKSEYDYHKKIADMWLAFIQKNEQK